jgi:hypothetical protein
MPRGGHRPGAGRKPGSVNALTEKTREIIERAAAEGILPLQVMLDNMRFYHREAGELVAKLIGAGVPEATVAKEGEGGEPHGGVIEAIGQVLGLRKLAGEEAARAAPYVHTRMGYAAGDDGGSKDDEIPLAERLKEYQRRDDLKAAGSNVVDLKRPGDQ